MRRIRSIRRSIPTSMAIVLMNSFIIARMDYCNSLLAGLPVYQTDRIQTVLNDAGRIEFGGSQRNHAIPVMRDCLHWLRLTSLQGHQQHSSRLHHKLLSIQQHKRPSIHTPVCRQIDPHSTRNKKLELNSGRSHSHM